MRIIADSSQMQAGNQALYVLPNSPYKTVQQLVKAHATVGVNTLHNIGSVLLGSLLAANGYKVNALKQVPEILPHDAAAARPARDPGRVAARAVRHRGAAGVRRGAAGRLRPGLAAELPDRHDRRQHAWVQAHPNTVAAFLRAYDEGQQVADTDRAAVEQALVEARTGPDARRSPRR